jgi:hypothetical protein
MGPSSSEEPAQVPGRTEEPAAGMDLGEEPAGLPDPDEDQAGLLEPDEEQAGLSDPDQETGTAPESGDLRAAGLSRSEASELADLKFHWDEAYAISWADGVYRASRMSQPSVVLTADTCHELRQQIRDDYATWQYNRLRERSSL